MTIKIHLGFFLSAILGVCGIGLAFAAVFSRNTRFWMIDQYVAGPHDAVIQELLPPTFSEHVLLWLGLGTAAIAAAIALVTLITMQRDAVRCP